MSLDTCYYHKHAVVTGGSSGLGLAIATVLRSAGWKVWNFDLDPLGSGGEDWIFCDVKEPLGVTMSVKDLIEKDRHVSVLINCAGINEINWMEDLSPVVWDRVMGVNAKGIYLMSQALLPTLERNCGTILNIVSNAAHIPMTSSLVYNASKAAAHMMTLQMARELTKRHNLTVFGIAPNKMKGTRMSTYIESRVPEVRGWTPEFAREYQDKSLLTGEETDPMDVARLIQFLLSTKANHRALSGCILPYGA